MKVDEFENILKTSCDMHDVVKSGDINSLYEYLFVDILFNDTYNKNIILWHDSYTVALRYLCMFENRNKECALYSYVLNHYYPGEFEKLFEQMIEVEEYEICSKLNKYKNVTEYPVF